MRRREALGLLGAAALGPAVTGRRTRAQPDPYEPLGSITVAGAKEAVVGDNGTTVYVATGDGFAVLDVSAPTAPELRTERRGLLADREGGPLDDLWDVKVDGDRLLVVGPAHGGGLRAAVLYSVADPAAPERLAVHETGFPIHNAVLVGDRAYLTGNDGDANPLVIVDMGADPPAELGRWSPLDHDDRWRQVPQAVRPLHDLQVRDDVAYLNYWDIGTWMVDVRDPAAPALLTRIGGRSFAALTEETAPINEQILGLPGNHHSCAVGEDGRLLAIGKEAWAVDAAEGAPGPGGVDLWDVASPASPTLLATIDPPPTPDPGRGGTWTTAHNFDIHGDRLYTAWYQGGVKVHDVTRPAEPRELAWWRAPDETAFWTAQHGTTGVIASDMGPGGLGSAENAGVYVFPDRAGEQPNPPSLTPTPSEAPQNTTATPSPRTDTTTASGSDPSTTGSSGGTGPTTDGSGTVTVAQPGFGVVAGLAGLGLWAWRRARRPEI